jgi:hypothetical protein
VNRRGIMTSRYLHITAGREKETLERAARALELQFDYYGPFGFGAVVARPTSRCSTSTRK